MDKRELVATIISELKLPYDNELAYHTWFWPDSNNNPYNVRLTKVGHSILSTRLPSYHFDYEFKNLPTELMQLSKMDTPFYVSKQEGITLYSNQLATMVKMYDSFDMYLELINQ